MRTSEFWQMAVVFESQPPFYIGVAVNLSTLADVQAERFKLRQWQRHLPHEDVGWCVHINSCSFYPLPRAYGNEHEICRWFDSTLCYCVVRKLLTRGIARKVFLWIREVILEGSIPSTSPSSISYYTLSSFMKSV